MRRMTIAFLGAATLALTACGSGGTFADKPRPALPVQLSVYINDARVSVSPNDVGAGPVQFVVTNQAARAESLQIQPAGGSGALADTGPISPQAVASVTVTLNSGGYTIAASAGNGSGTDATASAPQSLAPAQLHIGPPRQNADNALLQP